MYGKFKISPQLIFFGISPESEWEANLSEMGSISVFGGEVGRGEKLGSEI